MGLSVYIRPKKQRRWGSRGYLRGGPNVGCRCTSGDGRARVEPVEGPVKTELCGEGIGVCVANEAEEGCEEEKFENEQGPKKPYVFPPVYVRHCFDKTKERKSGLKRTKKKNGKNRKIWTRQNGIYFLARRTEPARCL